MELSKTEQQLMNYLWKLQKAFMKDLIDAFPEPKPASTTVATLLKRMTDKGFVSFHQHGNVREYYPLVNKNEYFSKHLSAMIKNFFNNSPAQFASFFTSETNLTEHELEELKKMVEQQIQNKQQ
jgi:predicted transcriptional regulator